MKPAMNEGANERPADSGPAVLTVAYRRSMWAKARAHPGIAIAAQSGHFFAVVDADWRFETWGRRARRHIRWAIANYRSNSTRTDRFVTPAMLAYAKGGES